MGMAQEQFATMLPRIESSARVAFAGIRCPHERDDAVADVVASAWEKFRKRRKAVEAIAMAALLTVCRQRWRQQRVRNRVV